MEVNLQTFTAVRYPAASENQSNEAFTVRGNDRESATIMLSRSAYEKFCETIYKIVTTEGNDVSVKISFELKADGPTEVATKKPTMIITRTEASGRIPEIEFRDPNGNHITLGGVFCEELSDEEAVQILEAYKEYLCDRIDLAPIMPPKPVYTCVTSKELGFIDRLKFVFNI